MHLSCSPYIPDAPPISFFLILQTDTVKSLMHIFQCLCSEGEIIMDETVQRGQHLSWEQHARRTHVVKGIMTHSSMPVEDDLDSSEVRKHTLWQMCNWSPPSVQ
jgi:hypothetical protein